MPEDLPIYSETPLRTGLQFAELDRLKGRDVSAAFLQADAWISAYEGATGVTAAREVLTEISKESLRRAHALLFPDRNGAGQWRQTSLKPLYRGQDCAPPEFIERSIDNLVTWLNAESFTQIHPIEQCALAMTRVLDIWPFEFGNTTAALVCGNLSLRNAGLTPFYVLPDHRAEFEKAVAQAMTIDMQPLINAIFRTVRKEMEALAK
ncbi:MAG TPA: Fic family protein [Terriglobia bacterium]|nr:Fic family protein [Terriglobia bacterium]